MAGVNTMLKMFVPQNPLFYGFFEEIADNALIMAEHLDRLVNEPDIQQRVDIAKEIVRLEEVCDDSNHLLHTELIRNFITPFDRDDIHYLASSLDDVADYIYSSAKKIDFYRINPFDEGIHKLSRLIVCGTRDLKMAVYGLREMKEPKLIADAVARINALEDEANDIFDLAIDRLFEMEQDFKELIKHRELYQTMESTTDKCKSAANIIESIVLKYA